jgi:hypothetical protein
MEKYLKDKTTELKIRISPELKNQYQKYCKDKRYSLSEKIRVLLENDMKND